MTRALASSFVVLVMAAGARADDRCAGPLQDDVCHEAVGSCPPVPPPLGLADGAWPVFQRDLQHTGKSPDRGPTCGNVLWTRKLGGRILSAPAMGAAAPGQAERLFVAAAKYPVCALDPADGAVSWCDTDELGKLPDVSSPAIGNGGLLYVGTRDNDLWAIEVPPPPATDAGVAWRQKICTDGDVSISPVIGPDGVVYMGSGSLAAGTIMAMCPGTARQVKWCVNPLGSTIGNVSPALNPAADRLYLTSLGASLIALDPGSGARLWQIELQRRRNNTRYPNFTPVVNPSSGRIYVGFDTGLFAVDPQVDPQVDPLTHLETPVATMLFPTYEIARERIQSPPALDLDGFGGRIYLTASRGLRTTVYALGLDGSVKWKRDDLGSGRSRNTPPVVDADGRVFVALGKTLHALDPSDGHTLWRLATPSKFAAAPIIAGDRLYAGTVDSTVYAIGGCP